MRAADFAFFDAPTPIGLAHRGGAMFAANHHLDNTLPAFRVAVRRGYRYLETDDHATSDGTLLAFHDLRLDRVTDQRGRIADLPYAAVRAARIHGTEPIPLLSDLLEEFPETRINIDVKAPGAIEPLAEVIRRHRAIDRVCVGSFSDRRLRAVRRLLGPRLATSTGPAEVAALRLAPQRATDDHLHPALQIVFLPRGEHPVVVRAEQLPEGRQIAEQGAAQLTVGPLGHAVTSGECVEPSRPPPQHCWA